MDPAAPDGIALPAAEAGMTDSIVVPPRTYDVAKAPRFVKTVLPPVTE